jgi:hypothetical protein
MYMHTRFPSTHVFSTDVTAFPRIHKDTEASSIAAPSLCACPCSNSIGWAPLVLIATWRERLCTLGLRPSSSVAAATVSVPPSVTPRSRPRAIPRPGPQPPSGRTPPLSLYPVSLSIHFLYMVGTRVYVKLLEKKMQYVLNVNRHLLDDEAARVVGRADVGAVGVQVGCDRLDEGRRGRCCCFGPCVWHRDMPAWQPTAAASTTPWTC